ncbi:hypothetical protein Dda_0341 [Drechslerella dactyloides]|uniref:Uncharacterized protein n=1 Tax=Drechslerella dactyloides TaxID=74499 RepID=A0AAD6J4A4_DREDA|nr:hypothetical protein Dda_0341 [Drechslerella dactyloides]
MASWCRLGREARNLAALMILRMEMTGCCRMRRVFLISAAEIYRRALVSDLERLAIPLRWRGPEDAPGNVISPSGAYGNDIKAPILKSSTRRDFIVAA